MSLRRRHHTAWAVAALFLVAAPPTATAKLRHSPCHDKSKLPGCLKKWHDKELRPYAPKTYPDHGLEDTLTPLGRRARGFYLTPYYALKVGPEATARVMKRAHMNAVVINIKGDLGRVLFPSKVELSVGLQKHLIPDPKKWIETFHKQGIYVIARLVCFKDSRLPYKRPDLSVRIGKSARRLFSAGANWIDAYSREVQDYLIDLAREAESLGFDEVQLDYIRFPKGRAGAAGTWLHEEGNKQDRATLIAGFLERMDRALKIPMSVDVYGLTTLVEGDPRRLGQTIENMAKYVEAISPMMYANGMASYFKGEKVTRRVYNIIHCGIWRAKYKAPDTVLRPWLQAYPNSVEHFFGPEFIMEQVRVCERSGCEGFLFWNSTMKNRDAFRGLRRLGGKYMEAFGKDWKQYKDPKNHPADWCPAQGEVWGKEGK